MAASLALGFWLSFLMGSLFARATVPGAGSGRARTNTADQHFEFGLEGVLSTIKGLGDPSSTSEP